MDESEPTTPDRMRVLMVSQRMFPYVAGAEVKALELTRSLIALGADAQIVTTRFARALGSRETIRGVPVRRLPILREAKATGLLRPLTVFLMKVSQFLSAAVYVAARGRSFHVVHAHCVSAAALGAMLGARLAGLPVVLEPSLGGTDGEIHKIANTPFAPALIALLGCADRFAVNNPSLANELIALGIARERIAPVKNGVDLQRFRPAAAAEREQMRSQLKLPHGPIALFVGQLIERKGIRQLLEAWPTVAASIEDAALVIVGDGEQAQRVQRAAGPDSRVMFLGVRDDVADLMRAADVLVLPSHNESFGNVVIEAMACGLPVVMGRTGVAHSLEIDGVAGRVVDTERPEDIAEALREILRSSQLRAALGSQGLRLVQQFDFRRVAGDYLAIYNAVIDEKRNGRR